MQKIHKFLVCLDSTDLDQHMIQYSSMIASIVDCDSVSFVNVAEKNLSSKVKKFFSEKISENFKADCKTEMHIIQGTSAVEILDWEGIKNVDFIVLGIKPKTQSTGKHAAAILDASVCSVLLVPGSAPLDLSKVIIPLDFSKNSVSALESALRIKERKEVKIYLHHVYFVPSGYTHTGKTYDEMAEIMKKNKLREYEQFKRANELDESQYEVIYELDEDQNPSDNIYEMAKEKKADMIIVSSRGRSKMASLLKKSTAQGLISYDREIACLVVKNKNDQMGFFEALMKL